MKNVALQIIAVPYVFDYALWISLSYHPEIMVVATLKFIQDSSFYFFLVRLMQASHGCELMVALCTAHLEC